MTVAFQRLAVRILAGHVGDRLADALTDARPGRRSVTRLEPEKLAEHGPRNRDVSRTIARGSGATFQPIANCIRWQSGRCSGTRRRSRAAGRGGRTA